MKKLLIWGGVSLITSGLLEPLIYSMIDQPIPWFRDIVMLVAGGGCLWLLVKYRDYFS